MLKENIITYSNVQLSLWLCQGTKILETEFARQLSEKERADQGGSDFIAIAANTRLYSCKILEQETRQDETRRRKTNPNLPACKN